MISDRGWNPLNRKLLLDNDLRATMTQQERSCDHHKANNTIPPTKFFQNHPYTSESENMSSTSGSTFSIIANNHSTIKTNLQLSLNFSNGTAQSCLNAIVKYSVFQIAVISAYPEGDAWSA